jgi:hypothetical protein
MMGRRRRRRRAMIIIIIIVIFSKSSRLWLWGPSKLLLSAYRGSFSTEKLPSLEGDCSLFPSSAEI